MKRVGLCTLGVALLLTMPLSAQEKPAPKDPKPAPAPSGNAKFMQAKLAHAQKVVEGLALEDFEAIAKNAQSISLLTQAEVWQVFQTPEYVQHSQEFRRAADAVSDAAIKKNIDAAALAYVDMTLKCVNCHKYVRTKRMASLKPLERYLVQQP